MSRHRLANRVAMLALLAGSVPITGCVSRAVFEGCSPEQACGAMRRAVRLVTGAEIPMEPGQKATVRWRGILEKVSLTCRVVPQAPRRARASLSLTRKFLLFPRRQPATELTIFEVAADDLAARSHATVVGSSFRGLRDLEPVAVHTVRTMGPARTTTIHLLLWRRVKITLPFRPWVRRPAVVLAGVGIEDVVGALHGAEGIWMRHGGPFYATRPERLRDGIRFGLYRSILPIFESKGELRFVAQPCTGGVRLIVDGRLPGVDLPTLPFGWLLSEPGRPLPEDLLVALLRKAARYLQARLPEARLLPAPRREPQDAP